MKDVMYGRTARKSFAHIDEILDMPNLLEVQKKSYDWFLASGLREVLQDAGTIEDYSGNLELSFIDYTLDEKCKYTVEECKERDTTYAAPLRVKVRLRNKETEEIKEQEIFMGDFPVMTKTGTFVINGAERVIVSQIVRSPGMYFDAKMDKADSAIYSATVIPYRGAWLEYETDLNDVFSIRIDKNRKLPVTSFIRALGLSTDTQIKEVFGEDDRIVQTLEKDTCKSEEDALIEIYKRLRPGEPPTIDGARTLINNLFFDERRYDLSAVGRYKYNKKMDIARRITNRALREPAVDPRTGEIIAEAGEILSREKAEDISRRGVNTVILDVNDRAVKVFGNGMVDMNDFVDFDAKELGVTEKVRFTGLCELLDSFEGDELRAQIVERLGELIPKHIIIDDIFASINYLNGLAFGIGSTDDIDHLGNRRLRSVGELLQNQFRIGFSRMERGIRERMTIQDLDIVTPQSLINIRPVTAAIKEFFGSSPLSQFMDQNNPLAELTHKRRMSALGPGGLSRDRASFEVRDVHYSHYGRMCPIETPEGPNIGLISYLASFARINDFGFIEAPYRKIDKETGKVTDEVVYMTADEE
ncbi:MAG: DNA-directed RNA polymerase subunit beta, partial [Oscillospiraceae bacterium]|nr:DNA-directed RNA polymerase subunit beta [Oscillospiraceae bacterium]